MTPTELITRVYIGYYNRVPDTEGLDYWVSLYQSGTSLSTIVGFFASAPETTDLYGNIIQAQRQLDLASIETFVDSIYQNLFRRPAEPGGLEYWTNRLTGTSEQPQITLEYAILEIMQGASGDDRIIMANKVAAGVQTVDFMRSQTLELPIETLRAVMDAVRVDPASIDDAVSLANATTPGQFPESITLPGIQEDQPLDLDAAIIFEQLGIETSGWVLTNIDLLSNAPGEITQSEEGEFQFTPDTDWYGDVAFDATLTRNGETETLHLSLTINPVNDAPVARHDFTDTLANQVLEFEDTPNLLANDEDAESTLLRIDTVNGSSDLVGSRAFGNNGGAFVINEDGSFAFEPMGDFKNLANGQSIVTSVTYRVTDEAGETATASVSVTVTGTASPAPTPSSPEEPDTPPSSDDQSPSSGDGYDIEFNFDAGAQSYAQVFESAATRLESLITQGLPEVEHAGSLIDDILINASVEYIDGVGGTLGSAGPEYIRTDSRLPYLGSMTFDSSDMAAMNADGTLGAVIIHEMLHVLGFGTLWSEFNLTTGADYTGSAAVQAYQALAGDNSLNSISLTTGVGPGSDYSHWDENTFDSELMTPYIDYGTTPISTMTVGALEDLGYAVNYAAADSYSLLG